MVKIYSILVSILVVISCNKENSSNKIVGNTTNSIFNEMEGEYFQVVYPNSLGPDSCIKDQKAVVFFANDSTVVLRKYRNSDCSPVVVASGKIYKIKVFFTSFHWTDPIFNEGSCVTSKHGDYYVLTPGEFSYGSTPLSDTLMLLNGSKPEK